MRLTGERVVLDQTSIFFLRHFSLANFCNSQQCPAIHSIFVHLLRSDLEAKSLLHHLPRNAYPEPPGLCPSVLDALPQELAW
jgi:hypothetical protein